MAISNETTRKRKVNEGKSNAGYEAPNSSPNYSTIVHRNRAPHGCNSSEVRACENWVSKYAYYFDNANLVKLSRQ